MPSSRWFDISQICFGIISVRHQSGSGIGPLKVARSYARDQGIKYLSVADQNIPSGGLTNSFIDPFPEANGPDLRLLAGSHGCKNANNDSLVLLVTFPAKKVLITGDAEDTSDAVCGEGEIERLLGRYAGDVLHVDLYVVGHHRSANGTDDAFLKVLKPEIALMSAGGKELKTTFSGWGYGHPRKATVDWLIAAVADARPPKPVYDMPGEHIYEDLTVSKAVYCTCWDGNIDFVVSQGAIAIH